MLHKDISPEHMHALSAWKLADSAALAAIVPLEEDEGKMAWVQDSNQFCVLVNYDPVTWVVFNPPEAVYTAEDIAIIDTADNYTGDTVEEALTEIAERVTAAETALEDVLTPVDITTTPPVEGDMIRFDGTNWVPVTFPMITVSATEPSSPALGDLWIDIS